jgi:hypothetical protein
MSGPITRAVALSLSLAGAAFAAPALAAWPPWLSIESPVNPYDPSARGATLLVHTALREGVASAADLAGSAEGLVAGARRSVVLRFDTTSHPGVYALRRQWPVDGTWMLRITLKEHTTALVTLDRAGLVASVRVPMQPQPGGGSPVPREVAMREIDSTLAATGSK